MSQKYLTVVPKVLKHCNALHGMEVYYEIRQYYQKEIRLALQVILKGYQRARSKYILKIGKLGQKFPCHPWQKGAVLF